MYFDSGTTPASLRPYRAHTPLLRRIFTTCYLLLFGCLLSPMVCAGEQMATEFAIKAAYLYNFTQFVQWPASAFVGADNSFRFCVAGENPFGAQLTPLSKRHYDGRPIKLVHLSSEGEMQDCHLVYVSKAFNPCSSPILKHIRKRPVLTVSSLPDFAAHGGIIGFVTIDNKVRLQINPKAAQRANIKLSAKLLEVASVIKDETSCKGQLR